MMAVNYRTSLKTTRMTAVRDDIDSGAGAGYVEICSAGYVAVLATIALADPCGSVSGDLLTFNMPASDLSADATGAAAIARIKESGGAVVVSGLSVGVSGSDINLSSVAFTAGDIVTLNSATLQHAA
jgi:hypothetical protein